MMFVPADERPHQSEPRSPGAGNAPSVPRSPAYKRDSPTTFDQDYRRGGERDYHADEGGDSPGGFRDGGGYGRGKPPTGPSNFGNGDRNSHSGRSPHHGRASNPALAAPSQPRTGRGGGHGRGGGYYADGPGESRGRGGPPQPSPRGHHPRDYPPPSPAGGGGGRGSWYDDGGSGRGGRAYGPRPDGAPHPGGPPGFRGSANSSSTTYPRTQVFNNPRANGNAAGPGAHGEQQPARKPPAPLSAADRHLADLPALEPDGRRHPAAPPPPPSAVATAGSDSPAANIARARRLEEEAERLRGVIAEKQRAKRAGLRDWSRLRADTEGARARADYAEQTASRMMGERRSDPSAF
jgi:hypothetical protein